MFTGIIEHTGTIEALELKDDGGASRSTRRASRRRLLFRTASP